MRFVPTFLLHGRPYLYADSRRVLSPSVKIKLVAIFLHAISSVAEYASTRRNDVRPGPDPALRLQQPLITKNFMSRATGSVICLLKHAGSSS